MNTIEQDEIKLKVLNWANGFNLFCFLDSNGYPDKYGCYDWVVAAGANRKLIQPVGSAFNSLKNFFDEKKSYLFGFLSYDLKNEVEVLSSDLQDRLLFPHLFFFEPEFLIVSKNGVIEVVIGEKSIIKDIHRVQVLNKEAKNSATVTPKISKSDYLEKVSAIKSRIKRGDVYELNFCQEFFAEDCRIDPVDAFIQLNKMSAMPFAGFFKYDDRFIISASPERFIAKRGRKLISQPIKGTARRNIDLNLDATLKEQLKSDVKERAENVMIVDIVRNDLTKTSIPTSVKTEELFGVYSFPQVHQLISTIVSELDPNTHFVDAIKTCYPMGSMTGAPKVRAMELIELYEATQRGMYSGSIGWINPDGDFDFNVVIRSLLYNSTEKYASFSVGGAITYASDPEKEYEECLLKAAALLKLFNPHPPSAA